MDAIKACSVTRDGAAVPAAHFFDGLGKRSQPLSAEADGGGPSKRELAPSEYLLVSLQALIFGIRAPMIGIRVRVIGIRVRVIGIRVPIIGISVGVIEIRLLMIGAYRLTLIGR